MDSHTNNSVETSVITKALNENLNLDNNDLDEITLHTDEHDGLPKEDLEIDEVKTNSFIPKRNNHKLSNPLKDNLLKNEETQQQRAPRSLFMGPPKKNRKSRGARKSHNKGRQTAITTDYAKSVPVAQSNVDLNHHKQTNPSDAVTASNKILNLTEGTPKNSKRQRSAHNTPENNPKKPRTIANVLSDDLKVLVVDQTNGINNDQAIELEIKLMEALDAFLETNPSTSPTYHASSLRDGTLRLFCADTISVQWIKDVISFMPAPWEGANLEVVDYVAPTQRPLRPQRIQTPRRPTIRFFIPNGLKKPDFATVVKKLQLQNPPIITGNWIAWKADDRGDGIFYHVSVDEEMINQIEEKECRLFYCFGKIKINLPKKPKGEGKKAENGDVVTVPTQ